MKTNKLSPEKSLELINEVITQARNTFEENGFIYVFWGALGAITPISQFALLKYEYYDINWYPYLLMPLGAFFLAIYFSRKKGHLKKNLIYKITSITWITLSVYIMVLGFLFANILKENLIPIILILLSTGIIVSGIAIKSRLLLLSGVIIGFSAFICFYIDWIYRPLLMANVSGIAILIPGIILMIKHKQKEHV